MSIILTCACGQQMQAREEHAGRRVACPKCGREVLVPGGAAAIQPAAEPRLPEQRRRPARNEDDYEDDYDDRPRRSRDAGTSGKATASLVLGFLSLCLPVVPAMLAIILAIVSLGDIRRSRGRLTGRGMAIAGLVLGSLHLLLLVGLMLASLLLPAFLRVRGAAERVQSTNNMRQIGLAMHVYHDRHGVLPPRTIQSQDGKPLLSWRVLLLPYLDEEGLYRQFKLDEPWDSPNNSRLLAQMPKVYARPGMAGSTVTHYQVFNGPGTAFEDGMKVNLAGIKDGTSNTWFAVEADDAVPWTKPEDLTYSRNGPLPRLGGLHGRDFLVLYGDGSVRFVLANTPQDTIRALITRDGGEILPPNAP